MIAMVCESDNRKDPEVMNKAQGRAVFHFSSRGPEENHT